MATIRQQKVEALIKKEMAILFQQESRILFNGLMISVTTVRISPDLGYAKVFLSFFPPAKAEEGFKQVTHHKSKLRWLLGQRVGKQLRVVPDLSFRIDDSLDYAQKIDDLLNE